MNQSEANTTNLGWKWKFVLQVIGCSVLLLPYAASQAGLIPFMFCLVTESYIASGTLIMFRKMVSDKEKKKRPQRKENEKNNGKARFEEQTKEKENANYFDIVASKLQGGKHFGMWYTIIRIVFCMDVVICTSLYFKCIAEIYIETWLPNATLVERSGYHFRVHFLVALILIVAEYVEMTLERHGRKRVRRIQKKKECASDEQEIEQKPHQTVNMLFDCKVDNFVTNSKEVNIISSSDIRKRVISDNESDSGSKKTYNYTVDMSAIYEMLHGYNWKRFYLLFFLIFLFINTVLLYLEEDFTCVEANNTLFINMDWQKIVFGRSGLLNSSVVFSIVIFTFMHYALFLPVCVDDLRLKVPEYSSAVVKSSLLVCSIFVAVTVPAYVLLGDSAPALYTTACGSNVHGANINAIALLFLLVAMLLRTMGCCRLIQVLLELKDSTYWVIAFGLFGICYYISFYTPSVLHLTWITGSISSNLLIIIFPRVAYINFLKNETKHYHTEKKCQDLKSEMFWCYICVIAHVGVFVVAVLQMILAVTNVKHVL